MEQPPNPLDNQDPLDDPMLDALERSIENPPGFVDPLVEYGQNEQLTDDLAKQLDQVEAGIENTPLMKRKPDLVRDSDKEDEEEDEKRPPPSETYEPPRMKEEVWGTFESSPPIPQEGSARTPPPNPPMQTFLHGGRTGIREGRGPQVTRYIGGRPGRIRGGISKLRFCPESREAVDEEKCESCEKYRHWPTSTKDEPRECWYNWQAKQNLGESDDDSDAER